MPESHLCPQCGREVPADAPPGVCPKCLLGLGFDSREDQAAEPDPTTPPTPAGRFPAPQPADLARHFPQLEILKLLGQGGMGAVYKARQRQLNRLVALKVLPPEVAADPAFAERFTREAQALAQLNHPHIVTVHDSGQAGGLYYFVMEYVDGVNLRRMLAEGKLAPAEALAIVPQICEALQYAHAEGVVHRDIKPENLLLDKRGRVKIADFGLARLVGQSRPDFTLTGTQQVMGTPHYMAPEQMERPQTVDHRADIYSLGVVFYEMLTGELPLGRFQPPSKKVQIDVRLDEVVLRSLEKEPERRYQHASDVKTAVEAIPQAAKPITQPLPEPASEGVVFVRMSAFCLLVWLVWSALLAGLQWGYLSDAKWYFDKELPYTYLSGAWFWTTLMFAFLFAYWWYLLAKSTQTERSLQDAWRCLQTPDRRAIRLWIPGVLFLAMFAGATTYMMSFADDDVQSTTLTALVMVMPLVAAGSCAWAYRERVVHLLSSAEVPSMASNLPRMPASFPDADAVETAASKPAADQPAEPGWQTWWFEQTPATRKMLKVAMYVFAVLQMIFFAATEVQGRRGHTSIEIGMGGSWLTYETGKPLELDILNWSFISGILAVVTAVMLWRVIQAERRPSLAAGHAATGFWSSTAPSLMVAIPLLVVAAILAAVLIPWLGNASSGPPFKEKSRDEARIEGTWKYVTFIQSERATDPEELQSWKIHFAGGVCADSQGDFSMRYTYQLNETSTPKRVERIFTEGPHKGFSFGIYKLEGDRLTICWALRDGSEPPTEFSGGMWRTLVVLKRE